MLQETVTADVIIIGGGVAGLSTALQLAQRGVKVIVLESERAGKRFDRPGGLLGQLRGTAEDRGTRVVSRLGDFGCRAALSPDYSSVRSKVPETLNLQ